ncbi:MAG: hypothetical protein ACTSXV_01945 [Alphaproteobacteria bacterium]
MPNKKKKITKNDKKVTQDEIDVAKKAMKDARNNLLPDDDTKEKYVSWASDIFHRWRRNGKQY